VPDAVVYHHRGGTTVPTSEFVIYHTGRNNLLLIIKTLPSSFIIKNLPLLFLSQAGEILVHLRGKRALLVFKSKLDAMKTFKTMFSKRLAFGRKKIEHDLNKSAEKKLFPPVKAVPRWL
jgi:GT2 family glycosyltransferase